MDQHIKTALHQSNSNRKRSNVQPFLNQHSFSPKVNNFSFDLCQALLAANISWNKLGCRKFREFLEKYTNNHIPDESTLRKKYLDVCYQQKIDFIRAEIGTSNIWAAVDETTDANGRSIANMIVGKLDSNEPGLSHLLCCKPLDRTNSNTMSRFVNDSLQFLWSESRNDEKVKLFLTDGASYMLKTGRNLHVFYPNMIHCTCLAHAINLLAQTIRENYDDINKIISKTKKVFLKAPIRRETYREMCPNIPLPPEPVLTRWGTWIEAAIFYQENFDCIKNVIDSFDGDSADCIKKAQAAFKSSTVQNNLIYVVTHFKIIVTTIKDLETKGEALYSSIDKIEKLQNHLREAPGKVAKIVADRFDSILLKNPGYSELLKISKILSGNQNVMSSNIAISDVPFFKYAPITSCDVERSFSAYKQILTDNRRSFTPENLEKVLICYV